MRLPGLLRRKNRPAQGSALVLFETVQDATRAEKTLQDGGYDVRLVAPPPELRQGCDLALQVSLVEAPGIERALKEGGAAYIALVPLAENVPALLDVVKVTDFGRWVMVKAGNMKLTFDRETLTIVNVSGGGCPDIPYLYSRLVGRRLSEAPRPRDEGFTLCARMLDRALEECFRIAAEKP